MTNLISSRQNFDIRRILDLYSDISDTSKRQTPLSATEKCRHPSASASIVREKETAPI